MDLFSKFQYVSPKNRDKKDKQPTNRIANKAVKRARNEDDEKSEFSLPAPPQKRQKTGIIQKMDEESVRHISTGQVIVNFPDYVKELIENSLDAKSKEITILFFNRGKDGFRIEDDGVGIHKNDFQRIGKPFNTSKISQFSDVNNVRTLGFRGEALSAICNMAKTVVTTKTEDEKHAFMISLHSNKENEVRKGGARNRGTTLTVTNIFEDFPVRKKVFLKNYHRDYTKTIKVLSCYAVVNTDVRFSVKNKDNRGIHVVFSTSKDRGMKHNISVVYSSMTMRKLVELNIEVDVSDSPGVVKRIGVSGYISKNEKDFGLKNKDQQFLYFLRRPIDMARLSSRINECYRNNNTYREKPIFFLNITPISDSILYDVNYAPDKRTMAFDGESVFLNKFIDRLDEMWKRHGQSRVLTPAVLSNRVKQIKMDVFTSRKKKKMPKKVSPPIKIKEEYSSEEEEELRSKRVVPVGVSLFGSSSSSSSEEEEAEVMTLPKLGLLNKLSLRKAKPVPARILTKRPHPFQNVSLVRDAPGKKKKKAPKKRTCLTSSSSSSSSEEDDVLRNFRQGRLAQIPIVVNNESSSEEEEEDEGEEEEEDEEEEEEEEEEEKEESITIDEKDLDFATDIVGNIEFDIERIQEKFQQFGELMGQSKTKNVGGNLRIENNVEEMKARIEKSDFEKMVIVGQFNKAFIVTRLREEVFLIDQHAADEKYHYERLKKRFEDLNCEDGAIKTVQRLVQPKQMNFSVEDELLIIQEKKVFRRFGFQFKVCNENEATKRLKLLTFPTWEKSFALNVNSDVQIGTREIYTILTLLRNDPTRIPIPNILNNYFASKACRAAIKFGDALDHRAMRKVVCNLGKLDQPWSCPHGRTTINFAGCWKD